MIRASSLAANALATNREIGSMYDAVLTVSENIDKVNYLASMENLVNSKVATTKEDGSAILPSGSTAGRDIESHNGYIRYNSTLGKYEGYNNGIWESFESSNELNSMTTGFAPTNLNECVAAGSFRVGDGHSNIPTGVNYGNMLVLHTQGADTVTQIITDYNSANMYWRSGNPSQVGGSGSWNSWVKIITVSTDGTGSGLDADLFDGMNSSEFVQKDTYNTLTHNLILDSGTIDSNSIVFMSNIDSNKDIYIDMYNGILRWYRTDGLQPFSIGSDNKLYADDGVTGTGKVWTSANDGINSGLDADTIRGTIPSTATSADTLVKRTSDGDIFVNDVITASGSVFTDGKLMVVSVKDRIPAMYLDGSEDVADLLQIIVDDSPVVVIPKGVILRIDSNIVIPNGHVLMGEGTGAVASGAPAEIRCFDKDYEVAAIVVNANSCIQGLNIIRYKSSNNLQITPYDMMDTMHFSSAIRANVLGTPITNVTVKDCFIAGFGYGVDVKGPTTESSIDTNTRGTWRILNNNIDCKYGIRLGNIKDTCYIANNHGWPFLGDAVTWEGSSAVGIPRKAFITGANMYTDWVQIRDCFSHSYRSLVSGFFSGTISGGGYDYEDYSLTPSIISASPIDSVNRGLDIRCKRAGLVVNGVTFNGGNVHIYITNDTGDNSVGLYQITGTRHSGATNALFYINDLDNAIGGGRLNITGCSAGLVGSYTSLNAYLAYVEDANSKINIVGGMVVTTDPSVIHGNVTLTGMMTL